MSKPRTIIHVNRSFIAMNAKDGGQRPVYTIKEGRKTTYAHQIDVHGHLRFIDPREHEQLPCGARAWAELVSGRIEAKEAMSFTEAKGVCVA